MGAITYTNLEDGTPITANIFNERFGQIIALLNGGLDSANFAGGGIPAAALNTDVFEKMYPVGSLYYNATDNTDPSELLGFGTWVAYAAGKVPVGYDATDTDFNAAEKTGGSKTHTQTVAEMPVHTHIQNAHTHTGYGVAASNPGFPNTESTWAYGYQFTGSATTGSTTAVNQNAGSGDAFSVMNPFITVYVWKRTA